MKNYHGILIDEDIGQAFRIGLAPGTRVNIAVSTPTDQSLTQHMIMQPTTPLIRLTLETP